MADAPAFDPAKPFETVEAPPFDPSKPFETASEPTMGTGEDVVKSAGSGLVKGATGLVGAAGDLQSVARSAGESSSVQRFANWLKGIIPDDPQSASWRTGDHVTRGDLGPSFPLPTSSDLQSLVEKVTGPLHKPETGLGRAAETVTEMVPGAIALGPAAAGRTVLANTAKNAVRYGVGPGLAAAGAGEITKDTPYEPWAKAGAGLAAGSLAALTERVPLTAAEQLAQAQKATGQAANRSLGQQFGVDLNYGQATGDLDAIRYVDLASRGAYGAAAQREAVAWMEHQYGDLQTAGQVIGEQLARGRAVADTPNAAASTINTELGQTAANARGRQTALDTAAEGEAQASRDIVGDQGRSISDALAAGRPAIENPREAGEIVGQTVRSQAAADRANYQRLYNQAFDLPGQFHAGALEGIGTRIQGHMTLGDNPVIIDDVTTPIASRAIRDIDNISNLRIQNRADPLGQPSPENIVAVDLRGVDQARKRLVAFYQAARRGNNPSDARAVGRMIDEFDNQIESSISNGLFSGDPGALDAIQRARGAYSNYARTYRPRGAGDDVGTAMRRIIDRNATPEEISNMILGSGRLGNAGLPVRLADRLETVLGADSDAWSAIRQSIWQRASQIRNNVGEVDPLRSAASIVDFSGSSLGRRMFSPDELRAMRNHGQSVRDLDHAIEALPATQTADRSRNAYQQAFGGEGIGGTQAATFRRIVEGTATAEETANAVFNAIGSGNPGNVSRMVSAIHRVVGPDSDTMAAIRQGVWQKLTRHPIGKDQPGQQKLVQSINEFLNGKGQTIARQLYSPDELARMQRYADLVRLTVIPKYARTNSDTTPALMSVINRLGGNIFTALGHAADHVTFGLGSLATGMLSNSVKEAKAARKTQQILSNIQAGPKQYKRAPARLTVRPLPSIAATPFENPSSP